MYCIKCGVQLADTERVCPLCLTRVYHPELTRPAAEPMYPKDRIPANPRVSLALPILMSILFFATAVVVLLCDLQLHRKVTWSGFVVGALVTSYVALVLPGWFRNPNPVIFVPCAFAAVTVYLMYINLAVAGDWFLPFAFPVTGGVGLIVTALVTLLRYVRKGRLFTVGGALMALGGFMLPVELLLNVTFSRPEFAGWSLYPLTALVLLGGFLIFLGICRPARESMERKFFF